MLYVIYLFTKDGTLGIITWVMSGSLQILYIALMFRLQYLLIMMQAPKVTAEETEFEIRKMKWIRFSIIAFMVLVIPLDYLAVGDRVEKQESTFATARLILMIVCFIVEVGTFVFLLSCFFKMQQIFRSLG